MRTGDWDACFARGVPMFAPYAPIAARWRTLRDFPALAELGRAWRAVGAPGLAPSRASLAIEPARALKAIDYERRIVRDGALGLREGSWHDLMNLLVWCRFPCAKLALSQAHVQAVRHGELDLRGQDEGRRCSLEHDGDAAPLLCLPRARAAAGAAPCRCSPPRP